MKIPRLRLLLSDLDQEQTIQLMEWLYHNQFSINCVNVLRWRMLFNFPDIDPWVAIPDPYTHD